MNRPVIVANCSGFFGDRISAAREMVEGGPIDVLTGDWLAELTMLILARQRLKHGPGAGYARTFLTQMEQVLGTCRERGIRVVSNAGGQRRGNGLTTEVGVGREELHALGCLARVEVDPRLVEVAHARHEVVSGDDADAHRTDIESRDDLGERVRAPLGIQAAGIGDDSDPALTTRAEHLLHLSEERARVARARPVLEPLAREDEHGQLGKPVAGEHVDRAALDHLAGRRDAVTEESAAVGDDYGPVHASASRTATT